MNSALYLIKRKNKYILLPSTNGEGINRRIYHFYCGWKMTPRKQITPLEARYYGHYYRDRGYWKRASRFYLLALSSPHPANGRLLRNLLQETKLEQPLYEQYVQLAYRFQLPEPLEYLLTRCLNEKNFSGARQVLRQENPRIQYHQGLYYQKKKKQDLAVIEFLAASRTGCTDSMLALGSLYGQLRQKDLMVAHYLEYADQIGSPAYRRLIDHYIRTQNVAQVDYYIQKLVDGNDPKDYLALIRYFARQHRVEEMEDYIQRADSIYGYYHGAMYYAGQEKAEVHLQKLLACNSSNRHHWACRYYSYTNQVNQLETMAQLGNNSFCYFIASRYFYRQITLQDDLDEDLEKDTDSDIRTEEYQQNEQKFLQYARLGAQKNNVFCVQDLAHYLEMYGHEEALLYYQQLDSLRTTGKKGSIPSSYVDKYHQRHISQASLIYFRNQGNHLVASHHWHLLDYACPPEQLNSLLHLALGIPVASQLTASSVSFPDLARKRNDYLQSLFRDFHYHQPTHFWLYGVWDVSHLIISYLHPVPPPLQTQAQI